MNQYTMIDETGTQVAWLIRNAQDMPVWYVTVATVDGGMDIVGEYDSAAGAYMAFAEMLEAGDMIVRA